MTPPPEPAVAFAGAPVEDPRLNPLRKSVYATGDFTVNTVLVALNIVYVFHFLTDVAGLRPELAGLVQFIGRTIESMEVRARFKTADRQSRVAHLANRREELDAALADEAADWVYVRFVPTGDDAARVRGAGKRLFIAGPTVAGLEAANWRASSAAGVDAILTDYPLELRRTLMERADHPRK